MTEPVNELVAELKSADRITRKTKRVLMVLSALLIVGLIAYFTISTVQANDQLKKLVTGENSIIENQSAEIAQIKANQAENAKSNSEQLQAIQSALQQQDDYIKCIAGIEPHVSTCQEPIYIAPATQVAPATTTAPKSSSTTQPTQSTSSSPAQGNGGNSGNGNSGNGNSGGSTPPPQKGILQQILGWIGL